jgi:hypothetical protein
VPVTGGRLIDLRVTTKGRAVTLTLPGGRPAGPVLFQLPAFVRNIAAASAGHVDEASGTVTLAPAATTVTVRLRHAA